VTLVALPARTFENQPIQASTTFRQQCPVFCLTSGDRSEDIAPTRRALEERLARLKSRRRKGTLAERVGDILRRVDKLPVLDARSADEIIGYDKDGLPR